MTSSQDACSDHDMQYERSTKVAQLRPSSYLGGILIYSIVYLQDGVPVGRGFARGDELDEWREDLKAAGWTLDETTEGAE